MQPAVAVFRIRVMIRARLRCRIDMKRGVGQILPQGTGGRCMVPSSDDAAGLLKNLGLIRGIHRKNFWEQEEEVTGQNQATCPRICPISRFSAL
jgi:hypothetical protein